MARGDFYRILLAPGVRKLAPFRSNIHGFRDKCEFVNKHFMSNFNVSRHKDSPKIHTYDDSTAYVLLGFLDRVLEMLYRR